MSKIPQQACLLCENQQAYFFYEDKYRLYYRCKLCDLIFVSKNFHLPLQEEKIQYDYHQNHPGDEGYRKFLGKLITPLRKYLHPGMQGLDFGSGPGPTMHLMLQEEGFTMKIFDPFYANDPNVLYDEYDFVTCSEVAEHFCDPRNSWKQLTSLTKKGGYLAIMTLFHEGFSENFESWWYKNDRTHVCFYSLKTFRWLEQYLNLQLLHHDERTAIFIKK